MASLSCGSQGKKLIAHKYLGFKNSTTTMGRRAKNKQGAPPSYDEFQAKKDRREKRKSEIVERKESQNKKSKTSKPSKEDDKISKVQKKQHKEPEKVEENASDDNEVEMTKKALFDDSDEENLDGFEIPEDDDEVVDDEFEVENDEAYDSDEDARERPMFSDDEDNDDVDLNAANMEALSRKLDEEAELEAEEAEWELTEGGAKQPRPRVLRTEGGRGRQNGGRARRISGGDKKGRGGGGVGEL